MSSLVLNKDLDVETLRNPYESDTEWRLRKAFLITHRDKLPLSRLQSLSCCFINTELYGNTYHVDLMEQLCGLISDLPEECKQFVKKQQDDKKVVFVPSGKQLSQQNRDLSVPVSFVKGNSEFQSIDVAFHRSDEIEMCNSIHNSDSELEDITHEFLSEWQEEVIQGRTVQSSEDMKYDILIGRLAKEFKGMKSLDLNFASQLYRAAENLGIYLDLTHCDGRRVKNGLSYFISELYIDSILFTTGEGLSKKSSKYETYTKAIEKLCSLGVNGVQLKPEDLETDVLKESFCESTEGGNTNLDIGASNEIESKQTLSLLTASKPVKTVTEIHRLSEFILTEHTRKRNLAPLTILRESAKFCKIQLQFVINRLYSESLCQIFLDGQLLGKCCGLTKNISREEASKKALAKLRFHCWTIFKKPTTINITREDLMPNKEVEEDLMPNKEVEEEVTSSENIGKTVFQKMDCTRAAIGGKGDKGRNHTSSGCYIDFVSNVKTVLKDYSLSLNPDPLTFLGPFFKREKDTIMSESSKFDLSIQRKGLKVIVHHNWKPHEMLSRLMECGESSLHYTLLPPGKHISTKVSNHNIDTEPYEDLTSNNSHQDLSFKNIDEDLTRNPYSKRTEKQNNYLAIKASLETESKQGQSSSTALKPVNKVTEIHRLSEFILTEQLSKKKLVSFWILRESAKFCKCQLQFVIDRLYSESLCQIFFDGQLLGECCGRTRNISKEGASKKALEKLRLHCWTILEKPTTGKETNITREDLMLNMEVVEEVTSSENSTSDGSGEKGDKGLVKSLSGQNMANKDLSGSRTGPDNHTSSACYIDFASNVKTVLKDYSMSSNPDPLTFSGPFSKSENDTILSESSKCNLSVQQKSSKVIVHHNWKPHEMLSRLMECGESSLHYTLLPPGKHISTTVSNHNIDTEPYEDLTSVNIDQGLGQLDYKEMPFSKSLIFTNSKLKSNYP